MKRILERGLYSRCMASFIARERSKPCPSGGAVTNFGEIPETKNRCKKKKK